MTGKGQVQHIATQKKEGLSFTQQAFLSAFGQCGTVSYAAIAAKCDRTRHYAWLQDEAYSQAFEVAQAAAAEYLENEARRRAVEGIEVAVFHQGKQVGTQHKYSDVLLIFLLKGCLPEKYRDRYEVTAQVAVPVPDPGREALSDAELQLLIETAKQLRE